MNKKRLAIYGCGKLAEIVVNAIIKEFLSDYQLIATYSRTRDKAKKLADKIQNAQLGYSCRTTHSLEELLALKPAYIVEAASPGAMKTLTFPALESGASIICLSIGALADTAFYKKAQKTAIKHHTKIHLVSGAIGGFDVLQTAALMGDCKVNFSTTKGPASLRNTAVYEDELEREKKVVFSGNAEEAIALFPTKVNVAVAASLASVGPKNTKVSITSNPEFIGDEHRIHIKNNQIQATVDVYSKTAQIAGWSVINTLRNIVSPVIFG